MNQDTIDPGLFRRVLGFHATGVGVITSLAAGNEPVGMAVTSFTSVSLNPPLVAFCPDKRSTTWPLIESAGSFCVNLLAQEQGATCRNFAKSGGSKFEGIDYGVSGNGIPLLEGALATIECELYSVIEAGDHFIVLGRVLALEANECRSPLLFFRSEFARIIDGGR